MIRNNDRFKSLSRKLDLKKIDFSHSNGLKKFLNKLKKNEIKKNKSSETI